ncbi:hypothetical protein J4Q44_G00303860 [Coregonus suidteri]|uniref:L27-1 domain-containing protein n=1 Tax=Coregonus suidteri TaxID=861788 RepID=A0AAN8L2I2_9TELE
MVHKYDTERAVGLLRQYQDSLTSPEEQALKTSVGKVSTIFGSQLFHALLDIQECYMVTLQLNTTQNGVLEASAEDAGETAMAFCKGCPLLSLKGLCGLSCGSTLNSSQNSGEEEGVSRVRVTTRRSPQKVEQVSGLVSCSHIETPKHAPVIAFLPTHKSVSPHLPFIYPPITAISVPYTLPIQHPYITSPPTLFY